MNLTKDEAKRLGRRAAQPVKAAGEVLAIWVPGKLVNTKNARLHYMAESRYKRGWRDRVAQAIFEATLHEPIAAAWSREQWAALPKRVTFAARTHGKLDQHDGLRVALAPVVDALIECEVIDGDAERHGHQFVYQPSVIDRARRGVTIRVTLRDGRR